MISTDILAITIGTLTALSLLFAAAQSLPQVWLLRARSRFLASVYYPFCPLFPGINPIQKRLEPGEYPGPATESEYWWSYRTFCPSLINHHLTSQGMLLCYRFLGLFDLFFSPMAIRCVLDSPYILGAADFGSFVASPTSRAFSQTSPPLSSHSLNHYNMYVQYCTYSM